MTVDASLLVPVLGVAALVVKAALGELRRPGSAREQWAFAADRTALAAGAAAAAAVVLLGWNRLGVTAVAWALLVGALSAQLFHRAAPRP
ncbi:hypothetical protein ACIF8T_10760 [Streptomyces sp. NPDC085946]|uniref:hypothetical protein n=1 Tax=Streptomyces sp. NPDC085946 TaxID=3365744 RepID=UPI0037D6A964